MTSVHDQFMSACVQRNEARFRELVNRVRLIGSKETINQTDPCGRVSAGGGGGDAPVREDMRNGRAVYHCDSIRIASLLYLNVLCQ